MIKLFRNIRKKLIKEGKTTNYLKYAIGEIVLVVIGILIALQINNWNEKRKLKSSQHSYLIQLNSDIILMHDYYNKYLKIGNERLESATKALKFVENCEWADDRAALDSTLLSHQALSDCFLISDTYNEMVSANVLAGLSNIELKNTITQLYSRIKRSNDFINYFRSDLGRASSIIWKHVSFGYDHANFPIISYNFETLCKSSELKNALVEVIDSRQDYLLLHKEIMGDLDILKELLSKELNPN